MQRHDLRRQSRPDHLRARDLEPRPRAQWPPRSPRVAFRGQGAQQSERRMRALGRLDLFLRSVVRAHAGLRRRAAAPARLSGRLSRACRRGRAAAPGRPQPVRAAERTLLLARRAAALRQRHGARADPGVRRQRRRHARSRPDLCVRHPLRTRARRAGRHEMRQRRQYLGHGARRRVGLCQDRCAARQGSGPRTGRQSALGQIGLAHAVHVRHALALRGAHQGRSACRAVHARRRGGAAAPASAHAGPGRRAPSAPATTAAACRSIRRAAR